MKAIVYLVNGVNGSALTQGIFSSMDGKMLKFGVGGKFLGEAPMATVYTRLREIDLISIINVDNEMEIAVCKDGYFYKFPVYAEIYDIIKWCSIQPNLVVSGKKDGIYQDGGGVVPYYQYFFGFTKGTLDLMALKGVMKVDD